MVCCDGFEPPRPHATTGLQPVRFNQLTQQHKNDPTIRISKNQKHNSGRPAGARTRNLPVKSRMLTIHLSYGPIIGRPAEIRTRITQLEAEDACPVTPRAQDLRSSVFRFDLRLTVCSFPFRTFQKTLALRMGLEPDISRLKAERPDL